MLRTLTPLVLQIGTTSGALLLLAAMALYFAAAIVLSLISRWLARPIEGAIEEVNATNTLVRASSGEPYVVPNGEITVIRNFSRSPYSAARTRRGSTASISAAR